MPWNRESNEEYDDGYTRESFERADEDSADDSADWEEGAECPACGGSAFVLGVLGKRKWFRCRDCGFDLSKGAS